MSAVGELINGVKIVFGAGVDREVHDSIVQALESIVSRDLLTGGGALELYVSSVSELNSGHAEKSRHYPPARKAIDISRVNDLRMADYYSTNRVVAEVTQKLQERFEALPARRENYGPFLQKKNGVISTNQGIIAQHRSHIHFSTN